MELKINGKDYPIYFGLDALDYLNNVFVLQSPSTGDMNTNMVVGIGGVFLYNGLENFNPKSIYYFIKAGTNTLKSKPSNKDIEDYIMELAEKDKLEKTFEEMKGFLEKCPLTKRQIQEEKKQKKALQKKAEKES